MRLLKLIIKGHRKIGYGFYDTITYTPKNDLQIIVGKNGSGKTRLLNEISPMPSNANLYKKNGSVEKHYEDLGINYTLISLFGSTTKHQFWREENGVRENLNQGGTALVQRDLVAKYFGITADIHKLLTGGISFTSMSGPERKAWMARLSTVDLTFATDAYNRFKSSHKDSATTLKYLNNRIAVETAAADDSEATEELEERVRSYQTKLADLYEMRGRNVSESASYDAFAEANEYIIKEAQAVINSKLDIPTAINVKNGNWVGQCDELLSSLRQAQGINEGMLSHYTNEYINLEGFLMTLKENGIAGIEELESKLITLKELEEELIDEIQAFRITRNVDSLIADTEDMYSLLEDALHGIPSNPDEYYNQDSYQDARSYRDDTLFRIGKVKNVIETAREHLDRINDSETVVCPNCTHTWVLGVDPTDKVKLEGVIRDKTAELQQLEKDLAPAVAYVEEAEQYLVAINKYKRIVSGYPRLQPLWDAINENKQYLRPLEAIRTLVLWRSDLYDSNRLVALRAEIDNLENGLSHAKTIETPDSLHVTERGKHLKDSIENVTAEIERLKQQSAEISRFKNAYSALLNRLENAANLFREQQLKQLEEADRIFNQGITMEIESLQSGLAQSQTALSQRRSNDAILSDLQISALQVGKQSSAYALLMDALSPTNGFIASQLGGVVDNIVDMMNATISTVWTHDLVILPSGMDGEDLDYRFPMYVYRPDNDVEDVSLGSKGEQQMIDLAFVIVAMQRLNLQCYPLSLDETGSDMEEKHRTNLIKLIQELAGGQFNQQVFFVCHFASMHDGLANADRIVVYSEGPKVKGVEDDCFVVESSI